MLKLEKASLVEHRGDRADLLMTSFANSMDYLVLRFAASLASISLETRRLLGCEWEFRGSLLGLNIAFVRSRRRATSEYEDSSL